MSQPRGFGLNGKSYYTNVTKPQDINLTFTVTPTNGLGVTAVKSNGYVRNVFMHTSTTPTSNDGYTNPNPANGYFAIQLNNNFNYYLSSFASYRAPNSGSDIKIDNSAMTAGVAYTITTLGDATAAKWLAIGVPPGITPAVGVSFIALTNGGAGDVLTSRVQVSSVSGVYGVEVIGNPGVMLSNTNIATNGGAWLLGKFLAPTFTGTALGTHTHDLFLKEGAVADGATTRVNAGTNLLGANTGSNITVAGSGANGGIVAITAGTPAGTLAMGLVAPTTGTVVSLLLKYDASSVTIDGI